MTKFDARKRLLFVDDDKEILQINKKYFTNENYFVEVTDSVAAAEKIIKDFNPDIIILDVMMPKTDGFTACIKFRGITNVPILFLSGKVTEEDKIKGFDAGADDYLEKPCSLAELKARINANIRRTQSYDVVPTSKRVGNLCIDEVLHKVMWYDEEIDLSKREYQLLMLFVKNEERLLTFEDIGIEMFGNYTNDDRRIVMVQVSRLRKKLELYTKKTELIETVWSKGYKLKSR